MNLFQNSIPDDPPSDIISWAETCGLKVDGKSFDSKISPQIIPVLQDMMNPRVRGGTLVKPVQAGGSTVGEILLVFWAAFYYGQIQYNWPNQGAAEHRWKTRIVKLLLSAHDLVWAGGRFDETICQANFVNSTIIAQGIEAKGALDSDSIPLQLNEEIHSWPPGMLDKARRRQTRIWNKKFLDISNAGVVGDQLEAAYEAGSMDVWENLCPGCKKYHVMRFRWDEKNPELGGLRFDTAAGRQENGKYNLRKITPTIRYQMPCGFIVRDTPEDRRALAGRYRPTNPGAVEELKSWTYEAVSVLEISWFDLVEEWLKSIRALKTGDGEPMKKFVQERECKFYSEESVPFSGMVVVNNMLVKSREGLASHVMRAWFADKQKGYAHKGEFTHYWLVIRDVMANADSLLVFEGLVQTDADLKARLEEHECIPASGAIDCGWDRQNVLQLCYREGYNAQTTSAQDKLFFHAEEKAYRIYSPPEGLHKQLKVPPKFDYVSYMKNDKMEYGPSNEEPRHWSIHRIGSLKLLNFLRGHKQLVERNGGTDFIKWEVPGDVSEDYKKQMESWEFSSKKKKGTNQVVEICKQRLAADHMLFCEAGIANLIAMAPHPEIPNLSILSVRLAQMGITESVIGGETTTSKNNE
jgi:hypothetical protein